MPLFFSFLFPLLLSFSPPASASHMIASLLFLSLLFRLQLGLFRTWALGSMARAFRVRACVWAGRTARRVGRQGWERWEGKFGGLGGLGGFIFMIWRCDVVSYIKDIRYKWSGRKERRREGRVSMELD